MQEKECVMSINPFALRTAGACLVLTCLLLGVPGATRAQDEQVLDEQVATLDAETTTVAEDSARVEALATKFGVSTTAVSGLRTTNKMGWGEVTVSLAMAQELAKRLAPPPEDPTAPAAEPTDPAAEEEEPAAGPTTEEALAQVVALRAEKMGWGKIAKTLGFKLGPVVSAAHRSEKSLHGADQQVADTGTATHGRSERPAKPERVEKPEKPARPERPQRPERGHRR
jgi:hypothetical protein